MTHNPIEPLLIADFAELGKRIAAGYKLHSDVAVYVDGDYKGDGQMVTPTGRFTYPDMPAFSPFPERISLRLDVSEEGAEMLASLAAFAKEKQERQRNKAWFGKAATDAELAAAQRVVVPAEAFTPLPAPGNRKARQKEYAKARKAMKKANRR